MRRLSEPCSVGAPSRTQCTTTRAMYARGPAGLPVSSVAQSTKCVPACVRRRSDDPASYRGPVASWQGLEQEDDGTRVQDPAFALGDYARMWRP